EVTSAITIDRNRLGADVLGHGLAVPGNDERLAVSPLQDFRFPKRPVGFAVQDLEQPGHFRLHAGIRAGENVEVSVTVQVHQLWSGAGASPQAGHFGHLPLGLQPVAGRELFRAKVLEDPDVSLVELSNEQMLLAVATEVGPTRGGVARAFHTDGGIAHFQTYRGLEVCSAREGSAAPEQECREQESLHGTILCWVK